MVNLKTTRHHKEILPNSTSSMSTNDVISWYNSEGQKSGVSQTQHQNHRVPQLQSHSNIPKDCSLLQKSSIVVEDVERAPHPSTRDTLAIGTANITSLPLKASIHRSYNTTRNVSLANAGESSTELSLMQRHWHCGARERASHQESSPSVRPSVGPWWISTSDRSNPALLTCARIQKMGEQLCVR